MKSFVSILFVFFANFVFASDLIFTGSSPVVLEQRSESSYNQQIAYLLEQERRVQTVGEAIALKRQGLNYVRNINDFEFLTSCPFPNPSDAYKQAVGDFIAQNVANYVYSPYDVSTLLVIEARVPYVSQAIAVKTAGLRARLQIRDFLRLIPPSVGNPSEAYLKAISTFVAQNIYRVLDRYSEIYYIVEAERYTLIVSEAMAVKNAGLVAVRTQRDLLELARYSVPNPSQAYQNAVNEFIRVNIGRYP